jgi:hypothetical protein
MSFIDDFEAQLVDAGRRRMERRVRSRAPHWLRVPRRRNAVVVFAVLLVGAPATAATVGWNPFDDPGRNPRAGIPATTDATPDAGLTGILAPLRRPQTDADRSAAATQASEAFGTDVSGVNLAYIRVLDAPRRIVLVPVERWGLNLQRRAHDDPAIREPDPADFANAVCLYVPGSDGTAARQCYSAPRILSGLAMSSQAGTVTGMVPDGVARVRLIRGSRSAETAVRDNVFVLGPPTPQAPAFVEWIDASGTVVRRIDVFAAGRR